MGLVKLLSFIANTWPEATLDAGIAALKALVFLTLLCGGVWLACVAVIRDLRWWFQ